MKDELISIRKNPRKMRNEYLKETGVLEYINKIIPSKKYSNKEKIDIILLDQYDKCYCGEFSKINSKWCSITCRNKDKDIRKNISISNKNNKASRSMANKKTLLKRYGVTSTQDIPSVKIKTKKAKEKYYNEIYEETFKKYGLCIKTFSNEEYLNLICKDSSYSELSINHFNSMPPMCIYRHFSRINYNPNFKKTSSKAEREIGEFISSLGLSYLENDRVMINPKELDIYIPSKRVGIEYHGLYWHSENKTHCTVKKDLCNKENIKLIQIFENEWELNRDIIKSIISSKLGIYQKRIYARNTTFSKCSSTEAEKFMNENHLQGFCPGRHYGLKFNDEIVSTITVGTNRFSSGKELIRYCSKLNYQIVGGFGKLLKNSKEGEMITYADLRFSDGETYSKYGNLISKTSPGYFWFKKNTLLKINRMSAQKKNLKKLLGSRFNPMNSESKNMLDCGYLRMWDCGHLKFKINIT
jgi:hypothetical protein